MNFTQDMADWALKRLNEGAKETPLFAEFCAKYGKGGSNLSMFRAACKRWKRGVRVRNFYTKDMADWIRDNYVPGTPQIKLYEGFCAKFGPLFAYKNFSVHLCKAGQSLEKYHFYSEEEVEWIKSHKRSFPSIKEAQNAFERHFGVKVTYQSFMSECYKKLRCPPGKERPDYPVGSCVMCHCGQAYYKYRNGAGGGKRNMMSIPDYVYRNNMIIPNCALAWVSVGLCERGLATAKRR